MDTQNIAFGKRGAHIFAFNAYSTQGDRGRLRAAGKIYFHLAADMVQKVGFTDAGIFLPTRG